MASKIFTNIIHFYWIDLPTPYFILMKIISHCYSHKEDGGNIRPSDPASGLRMRPAYLKVYGYMEKVCMSKLKFYREI